MILIIIIIKFVETFPENWAKFYSEMTFSVYDFEMQNFQYLFLYAFSIFNKCLHFKDSALKV